MVLILFCLVVRSTLESLREEMNKNITEKRRGFVERIYMIFKVQFDFALEMCFIIQMYNH